MDKLPPHGDLHFLPRLNKPFIVSPSIHNKLIPPYNSIVSKLNDSEFYHFLLRVVMALKDQLHLQR